MSPEALLLAGYAAFLLVAAAALEWLSAHTHRRALRYPTAGFDYDDLLDHWTCPEGEHLWPHAVDHERRVVRYRARAHVCNGCLRKSACTDSDRGREIVRPLDAWPSSEAGRFHRVLSLTLVALAVVTLAADGARNHRPAEAGVILALLLVSAAVGRAFLRDLLRRPSGFPEPAVARPGAPELAPVGEPQRPGDGAAHELADEGIV